ncbi:hypothetical protein BDF20DRAFT_123656 [Mycotypha africana]|uniref:uncharacterized protein n=1 Tax=Mycotypha africana TaxID=64632 RepID=UPI002300B4A0|nr:uncharacterized protein BDF20DRAFT_123656 [Mycotypha africana]KAI8970407.1 hypothetical protein BDF20DRAFT_123656 [Mycotypha africana]
MTSSFKVPKKRRLRQFDDNKPTKREKEGESIEFSSIENLLDRKRNFNEREGKVNEITKLFNELDRDLEERERNGEFGIEIGEKKNAEEELKEHRKAHLVDFDDNFLMNEDDEKEAAMIEKDLREAARLYLEEETQENIDKVLKANKKQTEVVDALDRWHQSFFRSGVKHIRQPTLISKEVGIGQKEIHISELSATSRGRTFLLESGCMKDWYHSGWKCPNYIYQWLFEVVGLETNKIAARNALSTLFDLWTLPGSEEETKSSHIYNQRYIELKTFKSVLAEYDAIPSSIVEDIFSSSDEETDVDTQSQNDTNYDTQECRHIPLSQLGWMVKAFSFSVRLWSKAYTSYEIRHTVRLLLQLSIDKTGYLVLQDIQTAIDNCLFAMDRSTWETETKTIANDICDMVPSVTKQMHLFDAIKPVYGRSCHFRRVLGVTCLERCLEKDMPGSVQYVSTDQSIIKQVAQIFHHPKGFFKKKGIEMDYEECYIKVAILDAAIGSNEAEIRNDKESILSIANALRDIGLQIGAKLGVMNKTLANEIIQRVWSRITYVLGKTTKLEL